MGLVDKLLSRNYHLALIAECGGLVAMFCRLLTGAQFVTLSLGIVTMFRAGDAVVNWIHRDSKEPDHG